MKLRNSLAVLSQNIRLGLISDMSKEFPNGFTIFSSRFWDVTIIPLPFTVAVTMNKCVCVCVCVCVKNVKIACVGYKYSLCLY